MINTSACLITNLILDATKLYNLKKVQNEMHAPTTGVKLHYHMALNRAFSKFKGHCNK